MKTRRSFIKAIITGIAAVSVSAKLCRISGEEPLHKIEVPDGYQLDPSPMRYEMVDGEWKKVEGKAIEWEVNPEWKKAQFEYLIFHQNCFKPL